MTSSLPRKKKSLRYNLLLTSTIAAGIIMLAACSRSPQYRTLTGSTWGTTYHITYCSEDVLDDSIIAQMHQIDMSLSPFQPQSQISRINGGERVAADRHFREVLSLSQHVCSISGGIFDPTVAPLINLWGFGYREGADSIPSVEQIDSAMSLVGIMACGIDDEGYAYKKSPNTEFNFSAIAKGYGVDMVAEMLRRNGCQNYMVEIGGEIALAGSNPRGEEWRIQIDAPNSDMPSAHDRLTVVQLTNRCIATSGNYRNYREITPGQRIGHTIDPKTGYPIQTTILSATVLAPTCALADALATALMAMSPDSTTTLLQSQTQVDVLLVTLTPEHTISLTTTPGIATLLDQ